MKKRKNVSKEELKNCLLISIEHNTNALDFVQNELNHIEDVLKYNEHDEDYKKRHEVLEYIRFSLNYLDEQYQESLKKLGVLAYDFNK